MKKRGDTATMVLALAILLVVLVVWGLLSNGGWSKIQNLFFTESIYVDALRDEIIIDRPKTTVLLFIVGNENTITFSKETRLKNIEFGGDGNKIVLCKDVHSPKIEYVGSGNEVIYQTC